MLWRRGRGNAISLSVSFGPFVAGSFFFLISLHVAGLFSGDFNWILIRLRADWCFVARKSRDYFLDFWMPRLLATFFGSGEQLEVQWLVVCAWNSPPGSFCRMRHKMGNGLPCHISDLRQQATLQPIGAGTLLWFPFRGIQSTWVAQALD